jgi:hypothetical protein
MPFIESFVSVLISLHNNIYPERYIDHLVNT